LVEPEWEEGQTELVPERRTRRHSKDEWHCDITLNSFLAEGGLLGAGDTAQARADGGRGLRVERETKRLGGDITRQRAVMEC
jgi:hypothetical protein